MITFIVACKDLLYTREKHLKGFLAMMDNLKKKVRSLECIMCDHGSEDGIKEELKGHMPRYVYVEPEEGQFLNMSKCFNAGTFHARNNLIAPFSVELRCNKYWIKNIIDLMLLLGRIILRYQCIYLDKNNKFLKETRTPFVLYKENIINCGGWDERMYGWGKEDDDLINRLFHFYHLMEVAVRGVQVKHLWHDTTFRDEGLSSKHNEKIMLENDEYNAKYLVNSYWQIPK